jgi:hypothetical protein
MDKSAAPRGRRQREEVEVEETKVEVEEAKVEVEGEERRRRRHRRCEQGEPGSSADRPITYGDVWIDAPWGTRMSLYVDSYEPDGWAPPSGGAPEYTITYGNVYVYNGPDWVNVRFAQGMLGTVDVRIRPRR